MDSTTEDVIKEVREIALAMGLPSHPKEWAIAAQVQQNVMIRRQELRQQATLDCLTRLTNAFLHTPNHQPSPEEEKTDSGENGAGDGSETEHRMWFPAPNQEQGEIPSPEDTNEATKG